MLWDRYGHISLNRSVINTNLPLILLLLKIPEKEMCRRLSCRKTTLQKVISGCREFSNDQHLVLREIIEECVCEGGNRIPLAFLDYLCSTRIDPERVRKITTAVMENGTTVLQEIRRLDAEERALKYPDLEKGVAIAEGLIAHNRCDRVREWAEANTEKLFAGDGPEPQTDLARHFVRILNQACDSGTLDLRANCPEIWSFAEGMALVFQNLR